LLEELKREKQIAEEAWRRSYKLFLIWKANNPPIDNAQEEMERGRTGATLFLKEKIDMIFNAKSKITSFLTPALKHYCFSRPTRSSSWVVEYR
jgi:hypothetical protein